MIRRLLPLLVLGASVSANVIADEATDYEYNDPYTYCENSTQTDEEYYACIDKKYSESIQQEDANDYHSEEETDDYSEEGAIEYNSQED